MSSTTGDKSLAVAVLLATLPSLIVKTEALVVLERDLAKEEWA